MTQSIVQQLRVNAVALISLFVALSSLGYNTWRNEKTEENRSIRVAAFEVLRQLGELQLVVNSAYFAKDVEPHDQFAGWGRVSMISDLTEVLPPPAPQRAAALVQTWRSDWERVPDDEVSVDRITAEIDETRETIRTILRRLR